MLVRRFLWLVAILIFLVIAAAIAYRLAGARLLSAALLPKGDFSASAAGPPFDYAQAASWAARPGQADPSQFRPQGVAATAPGKAAVFFVPPTAVFSGWNGRSNAPGTAERLAGFIRMSASPFNALGPVWAPHYRQAGLGSFLADDAAGRANAGKAQDLAHADVVAAFTAFLAAQPADAPIILAGHSQGSLHLIRLLQERVAGTPLTKRIVAVWLVGWPVGVAADLPALGLPACTRAGQHGCIISWMSFAEPADPADMLRAWAGQPGLNGQPRAGQPILCSNPLLAGANGAAPASANPGSLVPDAMLTTGQIISPGVPARCDAQGLLLIGPPPQGYLAWVMPGNNFHVFDYPLFWSAVRADAAARLAGWQAAH